MSTDWLLHGTGTATTSSTPRRDRAWEDAVNTLRDVWQSPRQRRVALTVLRALRGATRSGGGR